MQASESQLDLSDALYVLYGLNILTCDSGVHRACLCFVWVKYIDLVRRVIGTGINNPRIPGGIVGHSIFMGSVWQLSQGTLMRNGQ